MINHWWRVGNYGLIQESRRRVRRQANLRQFESLERRELMTADLASEVLDRTPAAAKIYTVLTLEETNAGGAGSTKKPASKDYSYYVVGNEGDVATTPTSGLALVGGGTDVDQVFLWMGAKANGGDFVVIRASGTDAYNPYIDDLVSSLDSVATLVVDSVAGANNSFVAQTVANAEAIFIAGGDQANYINFWAGTSLESAIYQAIDRGAPIGGTSAGLAVLGEYDFAARYGTITSSEALASPKSLAVDVDSTFLKDSDYIENAAGYSEPIAGKSVLQYLDNLITDSHFQQRDRFGRLVTFVARVDDQILSDEVARGIGINEQTALLIEPTGMAQVVGNPYAISKKNPVGNQLRTVYLLSTAGTFGPLPEGALNYSVSVVRAEYVPGSGSSVTFDLANWTGAGTTTYTVTSTNGVLSANVY